MSDKALEKAVEKLKSGDSRAFDHIYDKTYKVVFFVAFRILGNKHAAEDIVQDTYLKAMSNISAYNSDNFVAWITTIAKNNALNEYNRVKRQTATDFSAEENYREGTFAMPDEDSFGLISAAKKLLDETDYKIVIMCAVAGYKRREAAKALDMPISTVSYRLKQSLELLARHVKGGSK